MKKIFIHSVRNISVLGILFYLIPHQLWSQSPGGVSLTQELWLKADQVQSSGLPSDGDNVTTWYDWSGNSRDHVQYSTHTLPTFVTSGDLMNFQPSVNFGSVANTKLVGPDFGLQSTLSYYIFYVSKLKEGTSGVATLYSPNAARYNYNGWSSGTPFFTTYSATANSNSNNNSKIYGINAVIRPNGTLLSQLSYFNGVSASFTAATMRVKGYSGGECYRKF